jgi:hypothetical protein
VNAIDVTSKTFILTQNDSQASKLSRPRSFTLTLILAHRNVWDLVSLFKTDRIYFAILIHGLVRADGRSLIDPGHTGRSQAVGGLSILGRVFRPSRLDYTRPYKKSIIHFPSSLLEQIARARRRLRSITAVRDFGGPKP